MKSSDVKVATHADIANIRYCFFCQPGGVPHTLAVHTNWLNVHAGIMYGPRQRAQPESETDSSDSESDLDP